MANVDIFKRFFFLNPSMGLVVDRKVYARVQALDTARVRHWKRWFALRYFAVGFAPERRYAKQKYAVAAWPHQGMAPSFSGPAFSPA